MTPKPEHALVVVNRRGAAGDREFEAQLYVRPPVINERGLTDAEFAQDLRVHLQGDCTITPFPFSEVRGGYGFEVETRHRTGLIVFASSATRAAASAAIANLGSALRGPAPADVPVPGAGYAVITVGFHGEPPHFAEAVALGDPPAGPHSGVSASDVRTIAGPTLSCIPFEVQESGNGYVISTELIRGEINFSPNAPTLVGAGMALGRLVHAIAGTLR